jgi:hypothetical protein
MQATVDSPALEEFLAKYCPFSELLDRAKVADFMVVALAECGSLDQRPVVGGRIGEMSGEAPEDDDFYWENRAFEEYRAVSNALEQLDVDRAVEDDADERLMIESFFACFHNVVQPRPVY